MKVILKGNEALLNVKQVRQDYHTFEIDENDFDEILKTVRKAVIASRVIKNIALLKELVTKLQDIRPHIEYHEDDDNSENGDGAEKTLYDYLGQMIGIQNILKETFEKLSETAVHKFYVGRDTEMLLRKYAVFICS